MPDAIEQTAAHHLKRLIFEIQKGIMHDSKISHLYTNPSDFLDTYLESVSEKDRPEVIACIRQTVWTGFWKQLKIRSRHGPGQAKKGDAGGSKPKWL